MDRLTALVALLVLAAISFVIDPAPLRILSIESFAPGKMLGWLLAAGAVMLIVGWLMFRLLRSTHWGGRVVRTLTAVKENLSFSWGLLAAISLAFAIHLVNFSASYLFARALGISISYLQILLMLPVVLFLILLPVTINGHGLRELLLIGYFTQMGITLTGAYGGGVREIAVALSVLLVTNDLLWAIPGGLWYLLRFKKDRDTGQGSFPMISQNDFKRQWQDVESSVLETMKRVGASGSYVLGEEVKWFEESLSEKWGSLTPSELAMAWMPWRLGYVV